MRYLAIALVVCSILWPLSASAAIVYVPLDNRPVNLAEPVATLAAAGFEVVTPPPALVASRNHSNDPEQLWQWLNEQAATADAIVVAADAVIYGGLVASRTHDLSPSLLADRVVNFNKLSKQYPQLPLYVFSTVMRTPKMSAGGVEPDYYAQYGPYIFQYCALRDKAQEQPLTKKEQRELAESIAKIPEPALVDWLRRRYHNDHVNRQLLDLAVQGRFDYFVLGRDDNDRYSRTQQELRWLLQDYQQLSLDRFATFAGADQLGLLLLTRAANAIKHHYPFVAVQYAPGVGAQTIPSYQGEPVNTTVWQHILAAGAYPSFSPERADLVLAVNTAVDGITREANSSMNTPQSRAATDQFVSRLTAQLPLTPVAVADVAFGNGADNALVAALVKRQVLSELAAYSGWNTASNSIGFAVAQGILASKMTREDRQQLLVGRLLDDWAYQANVRQELLGAVVYPQRLDAMRLGSSAGMVAAETTKRLEQFASAKFGGLIVPPFVAVHPWDRMFEVQVLFKSGQTE